MILRFCPLPSICKTPLFMRLLEERKLAVRTVVQHVAAVRFLYCKTLKRRDMKEDLPYPRNYRRQLPVIPSPDEVAQVIDAARNLYHRAMLMTLYSCGLRRIEVCRLKVSDIDRCASRTARVASIAMCP